MPPPRLLRLCPPLLVALLLAGCAPTTGQVERALERELPRALGPADRYEVRIAGLQARTGRAERVTVTGERVQPEDAPVLDRLEVELLGVHYDRRRERLERVDSTRATARLAPADLAAFLEAHRNVREAAVSLQTPDRATLRLRPDIGGLQLPRGVAAEVEGRLVAEDGAVRFEVERVRALGADLGPMAVRRISEEINPVVDLSGTPGGLRVTAVRVEGGRLVLDAAGDLSGLNLR